MHFNVVTNYCIYVAVTMQGRVDSNLSSKGEFTLAQHWKEQLRVISDTIKHVDYNDANYCGS